MSSGALAKAINRSGTAAAIGLTLCALAAALLAAPAQAKEVRLLQGQIGSFTSAPSGLAVDQESHDLYAIDLGRSEVQSVTVSATAGKFKLKFKGETTTELAFNAPARGGSGPSASVENALAALPAIGLEGVFVQGGPGDAGGSTPYTIRFEEQLGTTDVEQLECLNGTTPLSGGSGCAVTTTKDGALPALKRFHADGTPAEFSALGSNAIDGHGPGEDQTPANRLQRAFFVALDESGGATDGDIYVSELSGHVVDVFAQDGKYLGQLTTFKEGPTASGPAKSLDRPCGIAVDEAGDLYLGDTTFGNNSALLTIHKYHPAANPVANADNVANFAGSALGTPQCLLAAGAGPTAGSLFSSGATGPGGETEIFRLDSASGAKQYALINPLADPQGNPLKLLRAAQALAVDPLSGGVFSASERGGVGVFEYDASSLPLPRNVLPLSGETPNALALDSADERLYLHRPASTQVDVYGPVVIFPDVVSEAASKATTTTATLNGTISADNGPQASCHFEYTTEAAYLADLAIEGHDGFAGATSAPCEPAGPFTGSTVNQVHANLTGLTVETKYRFRIAGENANTKSPTDDPGKTLPFETFGKPAIAGGTASPITTTEATITGEVDPHGLPTTIAVQYVSEDKFAQSGFNEATATPEKAIGEAIGPEQVSEQLTGLAVDAAYRFRLVATNEIGQAKGKEGAFATFPEPTGLLDDRAWEMVTPPLKLGEPYVPTDQLGGLGGSCWHCTPGWAKTRMPMQASPDGNALAFEGDPFAAGLASGANEYRARRTEAGWQTTGLSTPQMRDGTGEGFKAFSADLTKAVLAQGVKSLTPEAPEGFANLYLQEEGKAGLTTLIEATPKERTKTGFKVTYAGANAGTEAAAPFSRVIFQANDALTPAVAAIAPKAPKVGEGETDLYEWSGGQLHLVNVLPANKEAVPNAVFGSEKLLAVTEGGGDENYDFDHAISDDGSRIFWSKKSNGQLYVREGGTKTTEVPDHAGKFITATPNGSKVLLSDGMLYDLEAKSLTDLSGGAGGFQGLVGKSEDLSRIYFVDTAALTPPEEENASGEAAKAGKPNLYLWEGGEVRFIATLLPLDNFTGAGKLGAWRAAPGDRLAQATADGRFLAFESRAPLSGYDSTVRADHVSKPGGCMNAVPQCFEVFVYDAASGTLACPSCNPSGQAPLGPSNLSLIGGPAGSMPQPRNLPPEGEGRLFFESQDPLSLADQNENIQDVYEWEPAGVGSCTRPKGCLELLSGGQSPKDSHFLDASDTGKNAFFITRSQLFPTDEDDFFDVYDARSGGGFPYTPEEPCEAEACKGPVGSPPEVPGPTSSTFVGQEPPPRPRPPCRKGKVRRHGRCVRVRKHHHRRAARHHRQGGAR